MTLLLLTVLAAATDGGRPDAGHTGPAAFVWELPLKTIAEVPIEGVTWVNGVPVRLRELVVEGSPVDIGRHFANSFSKQHLYLAPDQQLEHLITGVDPESIVTYTVVIRSSQAGRTTVVLGEARPLEHRKNPTTLPVMPEAKGALPVQFEGYQLLRYEVEAPEAKVREFYLAELKALGYQPAEPGAWQHAGERVELTVKAQGARSQVTVRRLSGGGHPQQQ